MIHIYCGDGKGKTTAALGLICRHVGTGGKAVLAQFLKSLPTGELKTLELLAVPVYRNELPHGFFPNMSEQMQQSVREMHNKTLAEVTRLARANASPHWAALPNGTPRSSLATILLST